MWTESAAHPIPSGESTQFPTLPEPLVLSQHALTHSANVTPNHAEVLSSSSDYSLKELAATAAQTLTADSYRTSSFIISSCDQL